MSSTMAMPHSGVEVVEVVAPECLRCRAAEERHAACVSDSRRGVGCDIPNRNEEARGDNHEHSDANSSPCPHDRDHDHSHEASDSRQPQCMADVRAAEDTVDAAGEPAAQGGCVGPGGAVAWRAMARRASSTSPRRRSRRPSATARSGRASAREEHCRTPPQCERS
jgi:hypothetical protein